MKYKVNIDNISSITPKELKNKILEHRGIEDIEEFLNVNEGFLEDVNNYDNMEEGAELLINNLSNNIGLLIDSDCDGFTSATEIYQYIKFLNPDTKIEYFMHDGKEHGLTDKKVLKKIKESDIELLIIPDAGSSDYKEHKELKKLGMEILVLDHHNCETYSDFATVINNQLSKKIKNKNLAGVGVTYKFCKYLDNKLNKNLSDEFLDLVSLGCVSDMIDLKELEARYLVLKGMENINNPFLKALITKQEYEMNKRGVNILSFGWVLAPKINAMIRNASHKDKIDMFRAFIGEEETTEYTYRGKTKIETLQERMSRIAVNTHSSQNSKTNKGLEKIEKIIEENNLVSEKVMIIDCTGILDKTLTGLVANKLISKYKRPVVLLQTRKDSEDLFGGSARGYKNIGIKDFRDFCLTSSIFNKCEGHDNAFGIEIKKDSVNDIKKYFESKLIDIDIDLEETYVVDYVFLGQELNRTLVKTIGSMKDVWGNGVSEPLFIIEDIILSSKEIKQLGEKKNFVKFKYNDIEFLKEYASQDFFEAISIRPKKGFAKEKKLKLKILGKFKINKWEDKITPQVEILDFEVEEYKGNKIDIFDDEDFNW